MNLNNVFVRFIISIIQQQQNLFVTTDGERGRAKSSDGKSGLSERIRFFVIRNLTSKFNFIKIKHSKQFVINYFCHFNFFNKSVPDSITG